MLLFGFIFDTLYCYFDITWILFITVVIGVLLILFVCIWLYFRSLLSFGIWFCWLVLKVYPEVYQKYTQKYTPGQLQRPTARKGFWGVTKIRFAPSVLRSAQYSSLLFWYILHTIYRYCYWYIFNSICCYLVIFLILFIVILIFLSCYLLLLLACF